MNMTRDLVNQPSSAVHAAHINAIGLIDEISRSVVEHYREENGSTIFSSVYNQLRSKFGGEVVDGCLLAFTERFPPSVVYQGELSASEYLTGKSDGQERQEAALEAMLLLRLENTNRAFGPFAELIRDSELRRGTEYRAITVEIESIFSELPAIGPEDQALTEFLATPARLFPDSLEDQLRYMQTHWGDLLGSSLSRLLRGLDFLQEETKYRGVGPGPAHPYSYRGEDPERFSADRDWMPNVVLMAKSTLVWLDQLSKRYGRDIVRLDQIPDEELDQLSAWGVNALWLIGIWERSRASQRIKHILGNPEAEASAYALVEYEIAEQLGGWRALESLRERAESRGIRLASDMVPNHTGIDGKWVMEHPQWYVQRDTPPFPSYTFDGDDLSSNPNVGIYLEDHYYTRSDAAVVFRRTDHTSGETRYIYHGNDGTTMPWNDTAQLDFLNPEVQDAIVETILHVARSFPIIRFDAAMTLTKKHFQRLWYPEPGSGGDIPSRVEHGLTREDFDRAMPEEFWRKVVDRVAEELPDTLLLAEAFWMMEGYFVRTLGMHRVYNSAFMNMLKDEENAKYRTTIRNTIEFDKDILKRFVNFMNNPDEETAVAQFGTGDKYFGVCTMMATMPGLPMLGHGQIEGFEEKYGMEYRKAYREERPNQGLLERHEREIFPLLRRRHLFSSVEHFLLFDLSSADGAVNENVFAYANRVGNERSLVLYNNSYERAAGWIAQSAGFLEKQEDSNKEQRHQSIAVALGARNEPGHFIIFREQRSSMWFIRASNGLYEHGLYVALSGYQCDVFLDFAEVQDNPEGHYTGLAEQLAGAGVESIEDALRTVAVGPLLELFAAVVNRQTFETVGDALLGERPLPDAAANQLLADYGRFLTVGSEYRSPRSSMNRALEVMERRLATATSILGRPASPRPADAKPSSSDRQASYEQAIALYESGLRETSERVALLCAWLIVSPLSEIYDAASLLDEWVLLGQLRKAGAITDTALPHLLRLLLSNSAPAVDHIERGIASFIDMFSSDVEATDYLGFNEYEGLVWFNGERYHELVWWFFVLAVIESSEQFSGAELVDRVVAAYETYQVLLSATRESEFQVKRLLANLGKGSTP